MQDKQKIAVFDLDWTLLKATSAESLLFIYMLRHKMISFRNLVLSLVRLVFLFPMGFSKAVLKNRYYFKGISVAVMQACMPDFFESHLQPRLSRSLLNRMRQLKIENYRILLLSGTLDFILEYLVDVLPVDDGISSHLENNDGVYTGRIIGDYPYHQGKVKMLVQRLELKQIDLEQSCAFADTWADLPLLNLFGHPVVVHPDWILRMVANRRGWEIIHRQVKNGSRIVRFWLNRIYRPMGKGVLQEVL